MAALRPTKTCSPIVILIFILLGKLCLVLKGLYPLWVTLFSILLSGLVMNKELKRLNFYPFLRQPAMTKFDRSVTSTQSSSHSFATETGLPLL